MYMQDILNRTIHALKALDEKPSPVIANCDVCDERPGERMAKAAGGIDTWICDECDQQEYERMLGRRLPRFRSSDECDAYEAGSRTRGEI